VSEATAQRVVFATVLVGGAIVVWDGIKNKGKASPTARQLVTFTVLAGVLAVGASVAPSLFGPLALLILASFAVSRIGGKK